MIPPKPLISRSRLLRSLPHRLLRRLLLPGAAGTLLLLLALGGVPPTPTTTNATMQQPQPRWQPPNYTDLVLRHGLARAYRRYPDSPGERDVGGHWCASASLRSKPSGLLYNKMPKAASSTTAGIILRISDGYSIRHFGGVEGKNGTHAVGEVPPCPNQVSHRPNYSAGRAYGNRLPYPQSMLLSTVRDPAGRALSRLYFQEVSQQQHAPTDANMLQWLRQKTNSQFGAISPGMGGFQLAYLSLGAIGKDTAWVADRPEDVIEPLAVHENVRRVVSDYDLLLVVERYDESLVVMQLLLGLDPSDIAYLRSKSAGGYFYSERGVGKDGIGQCVKLVPAVASEAVRAHLDGPEWHSANYGDYLLREAASQSLDLTIDNVLGRKRFDEALQSFRSLCALAEDRCTSEAIFPCSSDGTPQVERSRESCYEKDWGCGAQCLDDVFALPRMGTTQ